MKQLYSKAFWVLFIISLIACRKETNNSIPSITFIQPQGESPDFKRAGEQIIFSISDDQLIQQARIGWVNEDFVPLNNPRWIEINSRDTTIKYWLSATLIPSGKAYIQIRIDDNEHTKLKYQPVKVSEGQELNQQIIFGYNDLLKGHLFRYDTTSAHPEKFLSTSFPLKRIEGNTENDLLAMLAENLAFIEIWSGKDSIALWRQEASFPEPKFSDWYLDEQEILLSDLNGNLRLHHFRTGLTQLTTKLEAVYRISAVAFDQEYIYAAVRDLQTDKKWLYLFFKSSGSFYKRFELEFLPLDLITVDEDQSLFLFATDAQNTQIQYFNANTESFQLKQTLFNFELAGPVLKQADNFYLHDSRTIQLWSSASNTTYLLAKGNNINGVATYKTGEFVFYLDDDVFEVMHPSPYYSGYILPMPLTLITNISK